MKIIGHRGARDEAPENTKASIGLAMNAGVDMIEVDLRLSGDSIVLSHNPILDNQTYYSLTELLTQVAATIPINLEIKEIQVVDKLATVLENYSGEILLSSFDFKTLQACRDRLPRAPLAVLESWSGIRATYRAKKLNTKRIHMNQRWLWSGFISSMSRRGWLLYSYTVNSQAQAIKFEQAGLHGIFTDYPSKFTLYYKQQSNQKGKKS